MNSMGWIGIIIWGLIVAGFGLLSAHPPGADAPGSLQPHDVVFLVAGGLITCLIGVTGLLGFMGWVPGLRNDRLAYKSGHPYAIEQKPAVGTDILESQRRRA